MYNKEHVKAVLKMQNYIKEHLQSSISLYDLAKVCGYSPWHTGKIFKRYTNKTPFEYIRLLRLSGAALVLRDQKPNVLDVALDFVFDTHEGFTRAFSKEFGISPKKYSATTPPIKLFMPYPVTDEQNYNIKGEKDMKKNNSTIFVQVIEKPARKLILKRGIKAQDYFEYCEEVGCDVWGILCSISDALYEPMGLWLPENMIKGGTSVYAQGVEVPVDYKKEIPDGFDVIDLSATKIMIFQGEPFEDENFCQAIDELWSAIENYDPEIYGFQFNDSAAPRFQLEPQGYRGYIEGRPVKVKNK